MSKLNLRALRMLMTAKGQNIAVALVVGIGLMFYIAMSAAIENLDSTVRTYYQMTHAADLYIELPRATPADVKGLLSVSGVGEAQGRVVKDVRYVGSANEKVTLRVISLPEKGVIINDVFHHDTGRKLTGDKDAFLLESFSRARQLPKGSTVEIQSLGQDYNMQVKGIVSSSEYVYLMENEQSLLPDFKHFGVLYVSEKFARQSLGTNGAYNQILIKIKPGYSSTSVLKAVEKHLNAKAVSRIYLRKDQLSSRMVQEEINGNRQSSTAVPLLFLSVAAAILYVMIARMVKNDRMTIGILKALGFNNRQIIGHYCLYALAIGLLGAVIGIASGSGLSYYITKLYATESFSIPIMVTHFQTWMFFSAVLLSCGFALAAGFLGAYQAVKIDPAIAMRAEAPKSGKRIWLESTRLWSFFSFTEKMVLRNMLRSKWRMLMLGIGVALTYMVIIMPIFFMDAFVDMFEFQYGQMQVMDYNVNFNQPMDESVKKAVRDVAGAKAVEGKLEMPFEIKHGHYKKAINVIGLEPHTQMYKFYDAVTGERLPMQANSIYMSEGLAKLLKLNVGDEVKLEAYTPEQSDHRYVITRLVTQNLGANLYVPLNQLQSDFMGKGVISGVYVKGTPEFKTALIKAKNVASLLSSRDMKETYKAFMTMTNTSIGMMLVFGIILGVAIVYNTVIMMMNERTVEIASMRVLGMGTGEVFSIFIREIIGMSLLGILMGIPLGILALRGMSHLYTTDLYAFSGKVLLRHHLAATAYTLMTVGLSLLLSYGKIRKSDFMDALKSRVS